MAAQIYKLWVKKVLWQSVILLLLHLQLYGIISIFKLHHAKENIKSFIIFITHEKYCTEQDKIHKDLYGPILQKEPTIGGKRCSALMLQITSCTKTLGRTRKIFWVSRITGGNHQTKRKQCKLWTFDYREKSAITLYYLKNTGPVWRTPNTFGVQQYIFPKMLSDVYKAINEILDPNYLYLPRNKKEIRQIVSKFVSKI